MAIKIDRVERISFFLLFPISTSLFGSCWRRASLSKEIGLFPSVYRHFRSNGRVGEGGETRVRELQTAFLKDSMISNWAAQMKFEARSRHHIADRIDS